MSVQRSPLQKYRMRRKDFHKLNVPRKCVSCRQEYNANSPFCAYYAKDKEINWKKLAVLPPEEVHPSPALWWCRGIPASAEVSSDGPYNANNGTGHSTNTNRKSKSPVNLSISFSTTCSTNPITICCTSFFTSSSTSRSSVLNVAGQTKVQQRNKGYATNATSADGAADV